METSWFIFKKCVGILIFMHLGPSVGKKKYRQTKSLEREHLRKRQGRGLEMSQNFRENTSFSQKEIGQRLGAD